MIKRDIKLPIREFAYFEREKVEDFTSALLGGLPDERKEITTEKPYEIGGSLGVDSTKLSIKKGSRELTREELLKATDASLFERLHSVLEQTDMIKLVKAPDIQQWDALKEQEFIEVQARVVFSALEKIFDIIRNFAPFLETFAPEEVQKQDTKNIFKFVQLYEQKVCNVRIVPLKAQTEKLIFVTTLNKEKIRTSKEELIDEYTVFGRIKHKLSKNETFELFNLLPGGVKLPREQIQEFLLIFKDMPSVLGTPPKMQDLRISYPAIILTPIAIYR
jgi:hypothetical protein